MFLHVLMKMMMVVVVAMVAKSTCCLSSEELSGSDCYNAVTKAEGLLQNKSFTIRCGCFLVFVFEIGLCTGL